MPPSFVRRGLLLALLVHEVRFARAAGISKNEAVAIAELFVATNGYTNLSRDQVGKEFVPESLELSNDREDTLKLRFNTLKPKAIGIKKGSRGAVSGWSVAFDYVASGPNPRICRVVTMNDDGTGLMVQHQDGIRSYFTGFD
jgi:hypothetical protein